MDIKRLDINLLASSVGQNFTKTANCLHLSQPAVSAQLSRLRKVFDYQLLIPTQLGMTLAAKALDLLEPLRHALDKLRGTVERHTDFDPARARLPVVIACTDYLRFTLVQPLVLQLRANPGVRVALRSLDIPQLGAQMDAVRWTWR